MLDAWTTIYYCTCIEHVYDYNFDFIGLFLLSIMGATQSRCAENCVFAVIKPMFPRFPHRYCTRNGSLHALLIAPPLLTSQLEKP